MRILVVSEGPSELGSESVAGALVLLVRRILNQDVEIETENLNPDTISHYTKIRDIHTAYDITASLKKVLPVYFCPAIKNTDTEIGQA